MARVLLIGFDPAALPAQDVAAVAPALEHARERAAEQDIELVECLVPLDESAVALIRAALQSGAWDCVVIGGGIRKPPQALVFFEQVVNLVHFHAPGAAIVFNTSPADTVDAALRASA